MERVEVDMIRFAGPAFARLATCGAALPRRVSPGLSALSAAG